MQDAWGRPGTLVSIESDVETSDDLIDELVACSHPACAYAYWIYLGHSGQAWTYNVIDCGRYLRAGDDQANGRS
jgi:hypothetical protein